MDERGRVMRVSCTQDHTELSDKGKFVTTEFARVVVLQFYKDETG